MYLRFEVSIGLLPSLTSLLGTGLAITLFDALVSLNSAGLNSWQSAKHLLHWPVFFPSDSEGALYDQVR